MLLVPNWRLSFFLPVFAEIEAAETCQWLRAAGFPQYAQMFEGKLTCREPECKVYRLCLVYFTINS